MLKSQKCSWSVTLNKDLLTVSFFSPLSYLPGFWTKKQIALSWAFFPKNLLKSKNHCHCLVCYEFVIYIEKQGKDCTAKSINEKTVFKELTFFEWSFSYRNFMILKSCKIHTKAIFFFRRNTMTRFALQQSCVEYFGDSLQGTGYWGWVSAIVSLVSWIFFLLLVSFKY